MKALTIDVRLDGRSVDRRSILKVGELVAANGRYGRIVEIGEPAEDGSIPVDITYERRKR
jgi:hypothetical protein